MSDKDSAPNVGDGGNLPGSTPSQPQADKPDSTSQPQTNPLDLLENQDFVEGLRRVFQSEKDRGVNRVQKEVKGIRDDLAELAQRLGVSPEKVAEVQREMEVEDAVAWYREQRQVSQPASPGSGPDVSGMIEGILLASGVDKSDAGVRAFLAQNAGDDAPQKLAAFLKERKTNPPSPAGISTLASGSPPARGDFENQSSSDLGSLLGELAMKSGDHTDEIAKIRAELERREPQRKILR